MKKFLAASIIAFSSASAFADKYVCIQYDSRSENLKQKIVVLNPLEDGPVQEGTPMKYRLELYEGASVMSKMDSLGTVETEDVSFTFNSYDKKVSFHIYLDEMNQSSLMLSNRKAGDFICH